MSAERSAVLVRPDSLGDTLDAVNAALFERRPLPAGEWVAAAEWIAGRQGLAGAYAGMFAPTGYDLAFGALTFTGEPIRSGAGTGHLLGEEALRALYLLGAEEPGAPSEVNAALVRARRGIFARLEASEAAGKQSGTYCCATCSVALWRHLQASGAADDQDRLENGMAALHAARDGAGRWKRFPFHYTLLALTGIPLPAAREELAYAAPRIEAALRRLVRADPDRLSAHDHRRRQVLQQALEKAE